jgi:hypothetical protein
MITASQRMLRACTPRPNRTPRKQTSPHHRNLSFDLAVRVQGNAAAAARLMLENVFDFCEISSYFFNDST